MKKIYILTFCAAVVLMIACSKDFLKSYDRRIQGTWRLTDVTRFGFGSASSSFSSGLFNFSDEGQLTYTDDTGDTAQGSWNIRRRWLQGNCNTDDNGNRNCDDRYIRTLNITVVNFTTQVVRSAYFDEIVFTGTNRFKGLVYLGAGTVVYYFRRQ